jgi:regulator of PEP synthase PpsR (kinase-PPPase family)
LTCSEEENIRRMNCDGRDAERIRHALEVSRKAYSDIHYPAIDITKFSVEEAAAEIIKLSKI